MSEPTKKQYDLLCKIEEEGDIEKLNTDSDIQNYWKLVRMGYLQNLTSIGIMWDWKFVLTEKGKEYLKI